MEFPLKTGAFFCFCQSKIYYLTLALGGLTPRQNDPNNVF
jgi:hypothetical protein